MPGNYQDTTCRLSTSEMGEIDLTSRRVGGRLKVGQGYIPQHRIAVMLTP